MHILIVAPEQIPVPPVKGGSVEICIHSIARKLAMQHQVTIISREHPRYKKLTKRGSLTNIRVATGSSGIYIKNVLNTINGNQYDLIQVDNRPQYAAAIKNFMPETPVALSLHSLTFITPPKTTIETAAAQMAEADLIIVNSSSLQSELEQLFPELSDKIKIVTPGVDLSRFRAPKKAEASSIRRKYGLHSGFKVLYTGRLIPRKGVDVLISAVHKVRKHVPGVRLVIAGGGQCKGYKSVLMKKAKKLKVPATFVGYIPHSKLHRIYWLGDCFVCPSQKHEAFGLVNVEAMASGLPVIASNNGGIKEIVQEKHNGLLVQQYGSPKAFADKILLLAADRSYSKKLGEQAQLDAQNRFGWETTVQNLLEIYESKFKI